MPLFPKHATSKLPYLALYDEFFWVWVAEVATMFLTKIVWASYWEKPSTGCSESNWDISIR